MPNEAMLEIRQVNGLVLSADRAWQEDSNVYLELYRALVTSGMLAGISGNALKVLVAMGLRARVLGGDAGGESLFRHLVGLKLVSGADRGKLFCYATQEDLAADCGLGSRNTLAQAVQCLVDHQLIEKRGRHRQRRRDTQSYVAHIYLIRPASSIRKFNAGYTPSRAQKVSTDPQPCSENEHGYSAQTASPCADPAHGPCAITAHNQKEEEREEEKDRVSLILAHFAQHKNDPTYRPSAREREKVRQLLDEGYTRQQIVEAIDRAFAARPPDARPVRGFGFLVSYLHRHSQPAAHPGRQPGPSAEESTAVLTEGPSPTGEPTGMTTGIGPATKGSIVPAAEATGDPLASVYLLLQAASSQGNEDTGALRYDLPGIRLGLRQFLDAPAPFAPEEVYHAVLAAVSRSVQPERLVGYCRAVLDNARAEARQRERLRQVIVETVHTGPEPQEATAEGQAQQYPSPDGEALALWQSARADLELQMTRATFDTWLRPARLLSWEANPDLVHVVLSVPNGYVKDWLENRLCTPIRRTLSAMAGQPVELEFRICEEP